ncbi:hypothetical protein J1614_010425 [Plenodomus biglobosus]|nr:hypothetical protein J1614_010425 [Plenodomus biglobosus]
MALSNRMRGTIESIMPKILTQITQRSSSNPPIDFGTAENWLIRKELVDFFKDNIATELVEADLSYQKGFSGDPRLIAKLAETFNRLFSPHIPVENSHIAVGPGGAAILESLLFNICDPGDDILVLAPFWSGFHFQFDVGPKVKIIAVTSPDDNMLNENVIHDLERAFANSERKPKGVVLCNPHNPLGQCYTKSALEAMCKFCEKHDLHLISDEIYALSTYESVDVPYPTPFVSLLSLDFKAMEVSSARAHVIWSISKDFGCSGFRLGALVTQGSAAIACGVAMAANTQVSSLTAIAISRLLSDPATTDKFINSNRKRLAVAYETMTAFLRGLNVRYVPAYAGIFIWVKLSNKVLSWDQEAQLTELMADSGVAVSAGKSYAAREPGWYRLSFAIEPEKLQEGLRRLAIGINAFEKD